MGLKQRFRGARPDYPFSLVAHGWPAVYGWSHVYDHPHNPILVPLVFPGGL